MTTTNDQEASSSRPLRILVAEDYADAREMLTFFLEQQGYCVAQAEDGPTALTVADAFQPDVAILDIGMPGVSGYVVAEALRRRRGDALTLVALSGLGGTSDKARAAAVGFNQHFTKPVDIGVLSAFLAGIRKS